MVPPVFPRDQVRWTTYISSLSANQASNCSWQPPAMAYNPGVTFFIPFHELDPSKQSQCIFFTQKGARCRWSCQKGDNKRAMELYETIIAISSEAVSLDLLQEYVLCNCCRSGRARHRDRIEDIGLLI